MLKNKGSVLITVLILLLVLSIMVVSVAQQVLLQQKMASNLYQSEIMHQQAEVALLQAEQFVEHMPIDLLHADFTGEDGLYSYDANRDYHNPVMWMNNRLIHLPADGSNGDKPIPVRYMIEKISGFTDQNSGLSQASLLNSRYFRVTARSSDILNGSFVILQSFYRR
ncbi:MAG: pilus assembly protein [Thiotrichaceae bacterium]|nr:pilus assembly protein [Thiotrichaceae bacterium]